MTETIRGNIQVIDDTITEDKLDILNAPSSGNVLTWNSLDLEWEQDLSLTSITVASFIDSPSLYHTGYTNSQNWGMHDGSTMWGPYITFKGRDAPGGQGQLYIISDSRNSAAAAGEIQFYNVPISSLVLLGKFTKSGGLVLSSGIYVGSTATEPAPGTITLLNTSTTQPTVLARTDSDTDEGIILRLDKRNAAGTNNKRWDFLVDDNTGDIRLKAGDSNQSFKVTSIAGAVALEVDTNISDFFTVADTDYSAISTIVGWSSFTAKEIYYKKLGRLVFVEFRLFGTSDSTSATFTLPYTPATGATFNVIARAMDNSVAVVGMIEISPGSATVNCYSSVAGATWTASNTKRVSAQFWFRATA